MANPEPQPTGVQSLADVVTFFDGEVQAQWLQLRRSLVQMGLKASEPTALAEFEATARGWRTALLKQTWRPALEPDEFSQLAEALASRLAPLADGLVAQAAAPLHRAQGHMAGFLSDWNRRRKRYQAALRTPRAAEEVFEDKAQDGTFEDRVVNVVVDPDGRRHEYHEIRYRLSPPRP